MKKSIFILFLTTIAFLSTGYQHHNTSTTLTDSSFKKGEWLKFRIHFGIINAGYATLKLDEASKDGELLHHAIGKGWTVGAVKWFFTVKDNYESYFTKRNIKPIQFKRRVNEDGYIISRDLYFNHKAKEVTIDDLKEKTKTQVAIDNVQDMVSAFYYLREIDLSNIKEGDEKMVNLFFDGETYPFKLKFLKRETIKVRLGEIKSWKIRPLVQKGRVFEGQESLTIWISDDKNKIPIRIKAALVVGSLKADLDKYSGLAHPINFAD